MVITNAYTFLFWNLNKKPLFAEIGEIVEEHQIDIVILTEFPENKENELFLTLNKIQNDFYPPHPLSSCEKIKIYTKFHFNNVKPIFEDFRITIRELQFPLSQPIILAAIHFPDKGSFTDDSQSVESLLVISKIQEIEKLKGHKRTILVGDFNMNPFEKPMMQTTGFHATMSSQIAMKKSRTVQGASYDYFYNPMWGLYGDINDKVSGTYYYPHSEHVSYYWNIFDQVLLRPDLMNNFDKGSLKILERTAKKNFMTKSQVPSSFFSDHLPIIFKFKL